MDKPDGVIEIKRDWLGRIKQVSYKCGESKDVKKNYPDKVVAANVIEGAVAGRFVFDGKD